MEREWSGTIVCMGVVWITGNSGAGKSSICEVLRDLGYRSIDADSEGFARWVDRDTGQDVIDPPWPVPPGWLDRFAWQFDVGCVRELAEGAGSDVVFLCGGAENSDEVWQYFDRVVCLVADDATTTHRVATRTNNHFGKQTEELAAILALNRTIEATQLELGASIVDSTGPLADVVREVLDVVGLAP